MKCSCDNMPDRGKIPHAGHIDSCEMSQAICLDHKEDFQLGCSICHNAMKMLGRSFKREDWND